MQSEVDYFGDRLQQRGRIAYDEYKERFRIPEQVEFRNPINK